MRIPLDKSKVVAAIKSDLVAEWLNSKHDDIVHNIGMWNHFLCLGLTEKNKGVSRLFLLEATTYADKAGFVYPHYQGNY